MYIKLNINGKELSGEYKTTKKEVDAVAYSVYGFYDKPSSKKLEIEEEIEKTMNACGGYGYRVTGGNVYSFSAVWFVKIDGEEFQIRHTKNNTFIEGPKTITIQNAIEEEKARRRKSKREEKERKENLEEDKQKAIFFIGSIYYELYDVLGYQYKKLFEIIRKDAIDYIDTESKELKNIYYYNWLDSEIKELIEGDFILEDFEE